MIKNVVFDMGNVLLRFDPNMFMEHAGITDPNDRELIRREVYQTKEWYSMDRGIATESDVIPVMCSRLPSYLHTAVEQLVTMWDRPILPVPGMADLVKELKETGYSIYLLSNASVRQHEFWPRVPGNEFFDGTLISSDVKQVKPELEIYRTFCNKFSLVPEECIFIDDFGPNIEAACFFGMHGIVFHGDMNELRDKLRMEGVNCRPDM